MVGADGTAMVLVRHPHIPRAEVAEILGRRWPEAIIGEVAAVLPNSEFTVEDAVEFARLRRGIEPLRVIVLPQRSSGSPPGQEMGGSSLTGSEPMPVLF
jgi:hypothetical protein